MMSNGRRKVKVSITLTPATARRVDRLGKMAGVGRSAMIEQLVVDSIEQTENVVKAATDPVLMNALAKVLTEPGMLGAMMSSLRTEVGDDQLQLFKQYMEG